MPDWNAIQAEYEQGSTSLRQLALKYGVSKTYLIEKRNKEGWTRPTTDRPLTNRPPTPLPTKLIPLPPPSDAISIARIGLHQLALHLQADMILEVKDHKLLSDALAQYLKVLVTAPQEQEAQDGLVLPLEKLLPQTRLEIRRLLAEDARQQQERTDAC